MIKNKIFNFKKILILAILYAIKINLYIIF